MPASRPPFYRSPVTRWASMLSGAFVAFTFAPATPDEWHNTPSLLWLHHVIPWPVIFASFVLYVALLATNRLSLVIAGDILGCFLYAGDLLAVCVTAHDHPVNGLAIAAFAMATVFHALAARLAIYDSVGAG